jgi:hypothetical protein
MSKALGAQEPLISTLGYDKVSWQSTGPMSTRGPSHQGTGPLTGCVDGFLGLCILALRRQGLDEDRRRID